ncbi:MAG: MoxR family ATPase [Candidatus Eremiobacterota bacterium]
MEPSLTEALGILGWRHLDPPILASLATEAPTLLVGSHGTAKSLLVERLALALGLEFRHYNAAILNYDDLVGIPLPSLDHRSLEFVSTPGSIWGARFLFVDELSRTRPDLQNKLFPILHERRVAGIRLEDLQHRWAAMNPPATCDPDSDEEPSYAGSEALDLALADRFPFVLRVPAWKELSDAEKQALVRGDVPADPGRVAGLVERCRADIAPVTQRTAGYVVSLVGALDSAGVRLSPRRARMLAGNIQAVLAACRVLGLDPEPSVIVEHVVTCSLPQTAEADPPTPLTVRSCHRQAWAVSDLSLDDPRREILTERDPVQRVVKGKRLNLATGEFSSLITQALANTESEPRCMGLAVAMFLAFRERLELTPAAWEALIRGAARVLEPRIVTMSLSPGRDLDLWHNISRFVAERCPTLERNFVLAGFPDLWRRYSWRKALEAFRQDLKTFEVEVS